MVDKGGGGGKKDFPPKVGTTIYFEHVRSEKWKPVFLRISSKLKLHCNNGLKGYYALGTNIVRNMEATFWRTILTLSQHS